jgi:hypothetical protein
MAVLEPALVAAELLLDPLGRLVEGGVSVGGAARALQHHAAWNVGDDVAGEAVIVRPLAERHLGRDGAGEIFVGDPAQAAVDMAAQRLAGIDLMTRDPDVHLATPQLRART